MKVVFLQPTFSSSFPDFLLQLQLFPENYLKCDTEGQRLLGQGK